MMSIFNDKKLPIGSVAYYVGGEHGQWKYEVKFGIVEQHYPSAIVLRLIEPKDTRTIDGIPVKEFVTPTKWKKLPKGWDYDTELFRLEREPFEEGTVESIHIDDPESILTAYRAGILVDVANNDPATFTARITKDGWRIERQYGHGFKPFYVTLDWRKVYPTYQEAKKVLDDHNAEFVRQANLSDYDWSVEQIDHVLGRSPLSEGEKSLYREWLLERDNVEDIEVRYISSGIQWKYWKDKLWKNIEIGL